jgi:SAM-dependent methyltransferase
VKPDDLLRINADDPEYLRQAAAESEFWQRMHPFSLEAVEKTQDPGPVDRYFNRRFTDRKGVSWYETIHQQGVFRAGAFLGTSSLTLEGRILETNPSLHLTIFDISDGPLERRRETLGKRFPGRVATQVADLNFIDLPAGTYDLIVSSSTIHHVTNLEYLAHRINDALTAEGRFFLEDYVGEPRFQFSETKKQIYQAIFNRDRLRQGIPSSDLTWLDTSDLSPFCGLRSDEILSAFRDHLEEVEVRRAGALVTPLTRSRPAQDVAHSPWHTDSWVRTQSLLRFVVGMARMRLFGRGRSQQNILSDDFLHELFLIGDVLTEARILRPGLAFASYRKKR